MKNITGACQAFPLLLTDAGYRLCCSAGMPDTGSPPQSDACLFSYFWLNRFNFPSLVYTCPWRPFLLGYTQSKKSIPRATPSRILAGVPTPIRYVGLFFRKIRNGLLYDLIHLFMGFSHCKSANCIPIQIQFRNSLCMVRPDIRKNCSLVNSKQQLLFINRIFQTVQTLHFLFCTAPASGSYAQQNLRHICALPHSMDTRQMPWQSSIRGLTGSAYSLPVP